jgi:formyl-CoA transferase
MLAAAGAAVVKVEPPFGDGMRYALRQQGHDGAPQSPDELGSYADVQFTQENHSKRGVAIALDTAEGQAVVHRLIEQADVMITNLLPGRLERYQLTFPHCQQLNPRLIIASVSSYGLEGPNKDWPGFDVGALFARGGHASLMGGQHFVSRAGYGDHCAGVALHSAILSGLLLRQQTGLGTVVSTSLLRFSQWMIASDMAPALNDGLQPPTDMDSIVGPAQPVKAALTQGTHITADGKFIRLTGATKLPALLTGLGVPELLTDPAFARGGPRNKELRDIISARFATRTLQEWKDSGDLDPTFFAPIQTLPEAANDPQVIASGAVATLEHGDNRGGPPLKIVNLPFEIEGADVQVRGPAPDVGQDTDEVLEQAGLSGTLQWCTVDLVFLSSYPFT